jgi:hypothetical protein
MVHIEIEGLAMGGATSPSNKQKGRVVFIRRYGTNHLDIVIFCTGGKSSYRLSTKFGKLLAKLSVQ